MNSTLLNLPHFHENIKLFASNSIFIKSAKPACIFLALIMNFKSIINPIKKYNFKFDLPTSNHSLFTRHLLLKNSNTLNFNIMNKFYALFIEIFYTLL